MCIRDSISIDNVNLSEGDAGITDFVFTVSVNGGGTANGDIGFTVNTETTNTTATPGDDYVAIVGGSGSILSGEKNTSITVQVNGDTAIEPNENFRVRLSAITNATATDNLGIGTITNDDVAGINVNTTTGITTEAGGTADFVFTLTSEPTANVTIPINGYDATETSGPASPSAKTLLLILIC